MGKTQSKHLALNSHMEKFLKAFITILSSLAALLLLFATGDLMMLQTQSGVLTITDKQVIESKTDYVPHKIGNTINYIRLNKPRHLQLTGKLNNGDVATFELPIEDENKFVVGKTYFCRYYATRFTKVHKITLIDAR